MTFANSSRLLWLAFGLISVEALFSVPKLSLELAMGPSSLDVAVGLVAVIVIAAFIARYGAIVRGFATLVAESCMKIPWRRWLLYCMAAGVVLRVLWVASFPAPLKSDYATFFAIAKNLAENGTYSASNAAYAYWPPGYPFFLAAHFMVLGVHSWVPEFVNLWLFCATILVVYRLAEAIADERIARLATLFLVLWPTYITSAGLASKEMAVVLLLPLTLLLYLGLAHASTHVAFLARGLAAGLVLGFATLMQPSILLLPGVLAVYELLRHAPIFKAAARIALVATGMIIVIFPWTMRNHRVLNAWVLISSNGGSNFYRANNPLATGGFVEQGARDLDAFDEVEQNRRGYEYGKQWIAGNPKAFLTLALRKQILFLGDDSSGPYETLKRGLEKGGVIYALFKGIANLYWWMIWGLLLAASLYHVRSDSAKVGGAAVLILISAYLFCIHSVYESSARYHVPLIGLIAILASFSAAPLKTAKEEREDDRR
jgi:4-amino-4-deoxy-L-arabinose transferase-like glycosyltransferase